MADIEDKTVDKSVPQYGINCEPPRCEYVADAVKNYNGEMRYDASRDPRYGNERDLRYYNDRDARYDYNRNSQYAYNNAPRYDNNRDRDSQYDYSRPPRYNSNRDSQYDYNRDAQSDYSREYYNSSALDDRYNSYSDKRGNARYNRRQRMRELAMGARSEETVLGLEQVFEAKLAAIRSYEQSLSTVTDPYARRMIQQMIRNERRDLVNLADLTDLAEQSPDMSPFAKTRKQFRHEVKMRTGQDLTFWLGAAAVGAVLLPSVRDKLRPLAVKAVQGVLGLTDQAQGIFSGVREDIEDLVSEAQFERFKNALDPVAEGDSPVDPDKE